MIDYFKKTFVNDKTIPISNKSLKDVINRFSFFFVTEEIDQNSNSDIFLKINESKVISICKYHEGKGIPYYYLVICFEKTIIFIHQNSLNLLISLFQSKKELIISFSEGTKCIFDKSIKINYSDLKIDFDERELDQYINNIGNNRIYRIILSSCLQYLVKKSLYKIYQKNRIRDKFPAIKPTIKNFKKEEFIKLKNNKIGSSFKADLIFVFDQEELLIIKNANSLDCNTSKLIDREKENYLKINHPLLPNYYGTANDYIVIEYITGHTLLEIQKLNLSENDKINIIYEILITIEYFHKNNMILRDLKPDNIMIDHNKTVVFIDFDQVINFNENKTKNFQSIYIAPDFSGDNVSYPCDIYSLGKIIFFIMHEMDPYDNIIQKYDNFGKHLVLKKLVEQCINEDAVKRPNIEKVIDIFFKEYFSQISVEIRYFYLDMKAIAYNNDPEKLFFIGLNCFLNLHYPRDINRTINYFTLAANQNDSNAQYNLGVIYSDGKYISRDINKAIHYLTLAANQNNHKGSQIFLGEIFCEGKYIIKDIGKAIHYYTLAANQNDSIAQYNLGVIYSEDEYGIKDMNKAIHFSTLAANKHHLDAQIYLGHAYLEGKVVQKDINKSIHYFTLAANQNDSNSQYNLGVIYSDDKYVSKDINKAIHYLTLAANQNNHNAQYYLGTIYSDDKYKVKDMNKAIQFLTQAANQNLASAQFLLGLIYLRSNDIPMNINKVIHYLTLSSNQYHPEALYLLGCLYFEGKYVKQNINKSIHYLTLSANQKYCEAQYSLGAIFSGETIIKDINKSIYYYSLAAKQNNVNAQINLAKIYLDKKNKVYDIDKSISYFLIASNQDNLEAHFYLGCIYSNAKYDRININKSIHYFSLAANNGHLGAQVKLGFIFYESKYNSINIEKSIHYFKLASNKNDPIAQFNLGIIYYEGKHILRDINQSIYYLTLAANKKNIEAYFSLGKIYYEGKYISRDIKKSIYYLSLAANRKYTGACFYLGKIYYEGKYISRDIKKSIYYLSLAANRKHTEALCYIGFVYYEGKYVSRNIDKTIDYLSEAAKQNYDYAYLNLGNLFYEGKYIKKNIEKAIYYFSQAAKQNNQTAQFNLGNIFIEGKYTPIDENKSIHYFTLAANQNDKRAQSNLGYIYLEKGMINKAVYYLSLSADQNFPTAQHLLGCIYSSLRYKIIDLNKAIYYFRLAANQNYSQSQYSLYLIYGYFMCNKEKIAIQYLIKAAQNNPDALFDLGFIEYHKGNMDKAIDYIHHSAKEGNIRANFFYGFLKHKGEYTKRDIVSAIKFYKEASCFYHHYSKNNIGIIYKNGFDTIEKNPFNAEIFFKEAIKQKGDKIAMYNLAHMYFYDLSFEKKIDESINLLIESYSKGFLPSLTLLCLAVIKKDGNNIQKMNQQIVNHYNSHCILSPNVIQAMINELNDEHNYQILYESYRTVDFLYNENYEYFNSEDLLKINRNFGQSNNVPVISQDFYNGFGRDLI